MEMVDTFRGDDAHLVRSIQAFVSLAAKDALVPPVPGMALSLLQSAAVRLSDRAAASAQGAPAGQAARAEPAEDPPA